MAIATATVVDDTGSYTGSLEIIARNAVAGFDEWKPFLAPSVGVLDIEIHIVAPRDKALASGGPVSAYFVGESVVLGGPAIELNTGVDPNGSRPDIVIQLDSDFLDSIAINPLNGSAIDPFKVDLVSIFAHEIGHGLGFFGYMDRTTYAPDEDGIQSTFDTLTDIVDGAPFFTGTNAEAVFGGPVPQTREHLYHLGNSSGAGATLSGDLMFYAASLGTTHVSALDAAVLADVGLATIFDDFLVGSGAFETMFGGRGDDAMFAFSGDDSVSGDEGDDYLRGGDGADRLAGGDGFDDINGNLGEDTAAGGLGGDWVVGGKDNDLLSGDEADDIVYGNLGADWCDGGDGADLVRGGQDDDVLFGQAGDDWLSGDRGNDTITGGAGADTFHSFGEAGIDRVTDFNRAEGDRVLLDPGTTYSVAQSGADVVVSMGGGGQMVLAGVQMSNLTGDWISGA